MDAEQRSASPGDTQRQEHIEFAPSGRVDKRPDDAGGGGFGEEVEDADLGVEDGADAAVPKVLDVSPPMSLPKR